MRTKFHSCNYCQSKKKQGNYFTSQEQIRGQDMQLQTGLIKGIPINTDHPRFIKNRQFSFDTY